MARYNRWQNTSLITASDGLTEAERWMDRGAIFKSIAATLNHLYWADALMLERIKGNERPQDTVTHSLNIPSVWSEFKALRTQRDDEIEQWAADIASPELNGILLMARPGLKCQKRSVSFSYSTTKHTTGGRYCHAHSYGGRT